MSDPLENIENISNNFDAMTNDVSYMKEKISNFYFTTKFKINFEGCHIAICRNGGLIAICKKKAFLDTQRNSKLNRNILVMRQNGNTICTIPITWNYNERWIVSFDFTENEKLYGICNDGSIYKFDILLSRAKEKPTSEIFKKEKIYKAKFIEKGFIALTCYGTFYYVKEFKNIYPISIFQMGSLLEFSNNIDFIGIPPSNSKSRKLELIFTNEKGNGVIHVMEQPKGYNYAILPLGDTTDITINGVSILENMELEPYIKNSDDIININNNNFEVINNIIDNKNNKNNIGKIMAMAISPSYEKIALYNSEGKIYIFSSKFVREKKELFFKINEELTGNEKNEQKALINLDNAHQFLFCGEDTIALSGQRFILIVNNLRKTISYKIVEGEEMRAMQGGVFSKCISEVDGLRYITNEGVFFISKVDNDLFKICYPFSNDSSKELLKAYKSDLMKEANCDKIIRNIYKNLSKSVMVLANAGANIFWIEKEDKVDNKKEIQFFILKAAQLGKYFVDTKDFNYLKFNEICQNIRIINELRNNERSPIFITYKEFTEISTKELIKNIMSQYNFKLAYVISKYLGYSTKKIYQKWAFCKIKKLSEYSTKERQIILFNEILPELKNIKKISYIKLAKKAFKFKHNELGLKFLELEKSILVKIPQYLTHQKYDKALELSYETYDSDIIATALNEIVNFNKIDQEFIDKIKDVKNIRFSVIDYLKKNSPVYIENYLDSQNDYEELLFVMLEYFFTSNRIEDKRKYIKLAKEYLKKLDKTNINNKFYLLYLTELDKSILFKKKCMDSDVNIIKKNYIDSFDNSIYDCYKLGVKENQFKWIEGENKNYELNPKKMAVMRIITMAENGKIDMVEQMVKDSSLKKLNLTPLNLAELYFDYKKYDLAVEYIRQMNNSDYFEYKVDMLLYMEKYEEALDIILSSKNMDRIPDLVNEILNKKPNLEKTVKDLCNKYKVNLN